MCCARYQKVILCIVTVQIVLSVVRDQSDIVHSENSCVLVFVRDQSEILRCAFVPDYSDIFVRLQARLLI